jgi:hypothetical protein
MHYISMKSENLKEEEGIFLEMGMDYWLGRTQTLLERAD